VIDGTKGRLSYDITVPRPQPGPLDYGTVHLPAGLEVVRLNDPSGGRWVLDQFPPDLFPIGSIVRHDAQHHGVTIPDRVVEEL
jgi:hypothetical protein